MKYNYLMVQMVFKVGLILTTLGFFARAESKSSSGTQSVVKKIETLESTVEIQGKKFKKIEIQKERFFVEALDSTSSSEEIRLICNTDSQELLPTQVLVGAKTSKRSGLVVEGIRQVCKEAAGGQRVLKIDPAILVGFQIEMGKKQNKKFIVSPAGVNFKADW